MQQKQPPNQKSLITFSHDTCMNGLGSYPYSLDPLLCGRLAVLPEIVQEDGLLRPHVQLLQRVLVDTRVRFTHTHSARFNLLENDSIHSSNKHHSTYKPCNDLVCMRVWFRQTHSARFNFLKTKVYIHQKYIISLKNYGIKWYIFSTRVRWAQC